MIGTGFSFRMLIPNKASNIPVQERGTSWDVVDA